MAKLKKETQKQKGQEDSKTTDKSQNASFYHFADAVGAGTTLMSPKIFDQLAMWLAKDHTTSNQKDKKELLEKLELQALLNRISSSAEGFIGIENSPLRRAFEDGELKKAFVMSIDIRRSTELMLKASSPDDFASFITSLCEKLAEEIKNRLGVYDKFTGDGILAFFPEFFSGIDCGLRAIEAADECHRIFEKHYKQSRNLFDSVLLDVGLGIGIDFGNVKIVQVVDGLTVVGPPVVYACRLGGADAGLTLLNHPAYNKILQEFSGFVRIEETSIDFKHQGPTAAYRVRRNEIQYDCKDPDWNQKPKS